MGPSTSADPRRAAAAMRLQRAKRVAAAASAGLGVLIWWLVAGSISAGATSTTPIQTPSAVSTPERDSFFNAAGTSGFGTAQQAPILRSHGS